MDARRLSHAINLARKVGHVLVATADQDGLPHLAAARRLEAADDGRLALSEWFCPGTLANLEGNARISIVAWDAPSDEGVQVLGIVEQMQDHAVMDGYDPSLAGLPPLPQVQKRLIVQPTALLEFTQAPHSDREE